MVAEGTDSELRRSKRLEDNWSMANNSAVSVEEEQERSPLLEILS